MIPFFHSNGVPLPYTVDDFARWVVSDPLNNTTRGLTAEWLVRNAIGSREPRVTWHSWDLRHPLGARVEVKSSGYVQSWSTKQPKPPSFDIAPKLGWDASTNTTAPAAVRAADVYVFALHAERDRATADPANVAQWEFYVVPTARLNEVYPTQKTLGLAALRRLTVAVGYAGLGDAVRPYSTGQLHADPVTPEERTTMLKEIVLGQSQTHSKGCALRATLTSQAIKAKGGIVDIPFD